MARGKTPLSVLIRSYQVGFGDCYLLTFVYGKQLTDPKRHLLIDFGTTGLPKKLGSPSEWQRKIAEDITTTCGETLHGIVVTHRHQDHLSGFAGKSGTILSALKPQVVIQPWTEHPRANRQASSLPSSRKAFAATMHNMHAFSATALQELDRLQVSSTVKKQLRFIGEDNLRNDKAVRTLMEMTGQHLYVNAGQVLAFENAFPGITFHVLGPPTLKQTRTILKQRSWDKDEFWLWGLQAASLKKIKQGFIFKPRFSTNSRLPFSARWFLPKLEKLRGEQLLGLVRILDKAMNNTSVILLIEVGKRLLLFPGDAQIENWNYALKHAPQSKNWLKLLQKVDVYKVGHHGSRNATPKTLWKMFDKKGMPTKPDRLRTLLSTMNAKHGDTKRDTEVPRISLVKELIGSSKLIDTRTVRRVNNLYVEEELSTV